MKRSSLGELLTDLREASRGQLVLRALIVGAALAAALVTGFVGSWSLAGVLAVPVLGALAAFNPHTTAPLLLIAFILLAWVSSVPTISHPATIIIALTLLIVHSASALVASLPAQAEVPRSVLASYVGRTAVVGGVTVAVWALSGMWARADVVPDLVWIVVALSVVLVALAAHFVTVGLTDANRRLQERLRRTRSGFVSDPSRRF